MSDDSSKQRRRIGIFLWLLPLWLVLSAGAGIWLYFRGEAQKDGIEQIRFATEVNEAGLQDDMRKFLTFIRERNVSSPAGVQGLTRAAAMIEGSLGPGNAGYRVERVRGPKTPVGNWPILVTTIQGKDESLKPVWVLAAYDSSVGSLGSEQNATGTTSVLAAASALANATPKRPVIFAFLPHAYDAEAPLLEGFELFRQRAANASEVLVIESMGQGGELMISTRDAENRTLAVTDGIGEVIGAEAICMEDDFDLCSTLFEIGLPAVRVSTRHLVKPGEPDTHAPDPALHAAATKALLELIGRLSEA